MSVRASPTWIKVFQPARITPSWRAKSRLSSSRSEPSSRLRTAAAAGMFCPSLRVSECRGAGGAWTSGRLARLAFHAGRQRLHLVTPEPPADGKGADREQAGGDQVRDPVPVDAEDPGRLGREQEVVVRHAGAS